MLFFLQNPIAFEITRRTGQTFRPCHGTKLPTIIGAGGFIAAAKVTELRAVDITQLKNNQFGCFIISLNFGYFWVFYNIGYFIVYKIPNVGCLHNKNIK